MHNKCSKLTVGKGSDIKNSLPFENVYIFPKEAVQQKAAINKR